MYSGRAGPMTVLFMECSLKVRTIALEQLGRGH